MILLLKTVLFTFLLFFEFINGQFLTEIPLRTLPTNLNGELESKHSISLSYSSSGILLLTLKR